MSIFDPNLPIEQALTPPPRWYTDPVRDQLEREHVLAAGWQAIAHRDQVAKPGSFLAGRTAGEPWLLVRDAAGTLRAFANICRHNGTEMMDGCGEAKRLTCPYHGWTYALDGQLAAAPRVGREPHFDKSAYTLVPLQIQEWGPLVLLNVTGDASPLPLADLSTELEAMRWNQLRRHERRVYDVACNWKVFIDNYMDGGYHVPLLHPKLTSSLSLSKYRTEVYDRYAIQSTQGSVSATDRIGRDVLYAWIYPNLMINRYGPMMDTNVVVPTGPATCRVIFDWYFDDTCDAAFRDESIRSSEQVQDEDIAICEKLQRGLSSRNCQPGPYVPSLEHGKYYFHQLLAEDTSGHKKSAGQ